MGFAMNNDDEVSFYARRKDKIMRLESLLVLFLTAFSVSVMAQTESVLYDFGGTPTDGFGPAGPLLIDGSGNLFGTTSEGSATPCDGGNVNGCGIVFELTKSSNGYSETVLYSFGSNSSITDGASPYAGLISDAAGNLYGTTEYGGNLTTACLGLDIGLNGCGTVFELVKSATGYTEKVLYSFTGPDGANPSAGLTMDSSGDLYGTTINGGACSLGAVFELANSSGGYTEKVLHSFGCVSTDGSYPNGALFMDAAGNLYGTAESGGSGRGIVFELANSDGGYTEDVIYSFTGPDGQTPSSGLISDSSGNFYGTTEAGGAYGSGPVYGSNGYGTVFELLNSSGHYTEKVLYSFMGTNGGDGQMPEAAPTIDSSGDLYGTTREGGTACAPQGCGIVYELVNSSGTYTERILHTFGVPGDGQNPSAPLVMDAGGNLYGTTGGGGVSFGGTAFEVTPTAPAPAVALSASSLDFSQIFNTTSTPQSITVTNTGPANLIFGPSGVALSGTNATEFAVSANSCSNATIAPNATCSVSITFTPKQAATSVAILTFFDNAAVGAQTVSLTGTATGITTTTVSSSSPSIPFGTNVTFTAQVTPAISGGPAPTGSVQFTTNGSPIGSAILSGGEAQVSTSTLAIGTISVVAAYGGDATYAASSGSFTQYVTNTPWYSVSAKPTALAISSPGQSVSTTLTFTSQNGLYGSGALSSSNCGIPASEEITCTLAPFTLPANGTTTALLTFSSTAASTSASVRIDPRSGQPIVHGQMLGTLASACFLCVAPLGFAFRRKGGRRFAFAVLLLAITVTCASCGGSGGSGGGSSNPGTPTGPVQGLSVSILIDGTGQTVPNLTLTVQ
jgi:uncharacterized repeat protein (TIGR03803 family)